MSRIPEPGDYCQWGEYDCEVLEFDAEHEIVWVLVLHEDREHEIRAMLYRPNDWH
jgi:hypothetical protein